MMALTLRGNHVSNVASLVHIQIHNTCKMGWGVACGRKYFITGRNLLGLINYLDTPYYKTSCIKGTESSLPLACHCVCKGAYCVRIYSEKAGSMAIIFRRLPDFH